MLAVMVHFAPAFERAEPKAVLDSVSGRVELVRASDMKWELAYRGMEIGNNDKLIVHSKGFASGQFPQGVEFYVDENSKLLFNLSEPGPEKIPDKIFTLYQGKAVFSLRRPLMDVGGGELRVYLKGLSLKAKEGAVAVCNNPKKGDISAHFLSGTYYNFSAANSQEHYIRGGREIYLDSSGLAVNEDDIQLKPLSLRFPFMSSKYFEDEIYRGQLLQKREQDVISGTRLGKVVVMETANLVRDKEKWRPQKYFSQLLAEQIYDVTYRELELIGPSADVPREIAKKKEADRIVQSEIHSLKLDKTTRLNEDSSKYELKLDMELKIKISILEMPTGKVLKEAFFQAQLLGDKYEAAQLENFLAKPLNDENPIFKTASFLKIIRGLKAQIRRFARSAV